MSAFVRPKKHLGQHFLTDDNIAKKIVDSIPTGDFPILEIGPGMGVLTKFLLQDGRTVHFFMDTDAESIDYLKDKFSGHSDQFIHADFLKARLDRYYMDRFIIIGNLPYNISSQILFKVLEHRQQVSHVICMIQKEVAERLAAGPGSKTYGILSVLLQAFYRIEYLFTVNETVFLPPPKVKSAVIRLSRNDTVRLDCDEDKFFKVVKTAFNQRRKTLHNSLKSFNIDYEREGLGHLERKRAEELSVEDFVTITRAVIKEKSLL